MALGLHPNRRHDGSNFHAAKEKFRINLSGQPVPWGLENVQGHPGHAIPQRDQRVLLALQLHTRQSPVSINGIFS